MQTSKRIYVLVFLIVLSAGRISGQEGFMQDLERVNSLFGKGQFCKMTYRLFRAGVESPVEVLEGSYLSKGKNYILEIAGTKVISIEKERLLINEPEKFMALAKPALFGEYGQVDFSQIEPFIDTVKMVPGLPEHIKGYALFLKPYLSNPYKRIEMYIDTQTGYPVKIRLLYANEIDFSTDNSGALGYPIIEVRYKEIRPRSIPDKEFDTKRYYSCVKGTCSGKGAYTGYAFYNQKDL